MSDLGAPPSPAAVDTVCRRVCRRAQALPVMINQYTQLAYDLAQTVAVADDIQATQHYRVAVAHNLPAADTKQITFVHQEGVPGWVVVHRRALVIPDTRQDGRVHPYVVASGIRSVMAAPLIVQERVVGVLNFFARWRHAFHEDDLRVAQMYADQAAIFVHNAGWRPARRAKPAQLKVGFLTE